jgi:excisionase family DNA binding protein
MWDADELMSLGQAAALLGCARSSVDRWVKAGKLPAATLPPAYRRQGRKRYVRRADVERLRDEGVRQQMDQRRRQRQ